MECDSLVIINPSTVSLSKTRFPDGGEVKQFSDNDTKGRAGQWYIVLSGGRDENHTNRPRRHSTVASRYPGNSLVYKTKVPSGALQP